MRQKTLVYQLASLVQAYGNCLSQRTNLDHYKAMAGKHEATLADLVRNGMPSGSGFDSGTHLDLVKSRVDRLVFTTSYHHMNEHGMYDGWTEHVVTIVATLTGYDTKVSGRNRNQIKDCIADTFRCSLDAEIPD